MECPRAAEGVAVSADDGSRPSVRLPERLDRSARLGPFPSGGGAVRFLVLGGVGAILALAWGPLVWLPFLGGGLFLGVYRFEGEPVDERVLSYARWRWRRFRPSEGPTARTPGGLPGEVRLPSGDWCAGFAAGGMPVAFLPAPAAERVFRLYRDLLRGCELSVSYRSTGPPCASVDFRPGSRRLTRASWRPGRGTASFSSS